ncbi:MAG: hypothetical protein FWC41_01445 [Firmicutes bacterium]|nr:hypothetical protein [Bacillota bacterium]
MNINHSIPDNIAFFCCASFEERCKSISLAINKSKVNCAYIFYDSNYTSDAVVSEISEYLPNCEIKQLNMKNPIEVADIFAKAIEKIQISGIENIVIDITTFTHEWLLILLKIVHSYKNAFKQIRCMYTGAQDYGGASVSSEQKWLSKGCKDVRNVLGYPGILRPSEKNCLIVLAGFELERATRLIELVEPDKIVIGNGIDPTNVSLTDTMTFFRKKFDDWKKEYKHRNCKNFDFSCKDIFSTVKEIEKIVNTDPTDNYIVVPLNTKLSTIAAALVAFQNPKIQLCYSIPEEYNVKNYSIPGNKITVFDLNTT